MIKYIKQNAFKSIMRGKIAIIMTVIFLFSVLSVFSLTSYPQIGGQNSQFKTGTGFFNSELTVVDDYTKSLTNGKFVPLVDDLDGDGVDEIVVVDSNVLRLFQDKTLDILAGTTITAVNERYSPPIIFDIDGDSEKEIIIAGQDTEEIWVFHWNGATLNKEFTLSYSSLGSHINGEVMLSCGQVQECVMFYSDVIENDDTTANYGNRNYSSVFFNTGGFGNVLTLETTLGNSQQRAFCSPKIPEVQYQDYDVDGEVEYIASFLDYVRFQTAGGEQETYYLDYVSINRSTASLPSSVFSQVTLSSAFHNGASRLSQVNAKDGTLYKVDLNVGNFYLNFSSDLGANPILRVFGNNDDTKPILVYRQNDTSRLIGNFTITSATSVWHNLTLNVSEENLRNIMFVISYAGSSKSDIDYIVADRVYTTTTTIYNLTKERSLSNTVGNILQTSSNSFASCNGSVRLSGASSDTNAGAGSILTSPLVSDLASNSGLETVVGYMNSGTTFNMKIYQSTGATESSALIDTSPDIADADGTLVSNPFLADVFPDNVADEYCVIGYRETFNIVDVLCDSEYTTRNGDDTIEFFYEALEYNISRAYGKYNSIAHSTQQSTATLDGGNPSEILNSYGVFEITHDDCDVAGCGIASCTFNLCAMDKIFDVPVDDLAMISVDAQNSGREDLIGLTSTNIWYFDDGFSNSPAIIDAYQINPCIDSTWKANTTVEARITPTDADGDTVSARAVIYDGLNFSQDSGWSSYSSSGATFTFSFIASELVSTGTMILYARDSVNPSEPDSIPITFSVSTSGVEYGDCKTTIDVEQVENATGNLSGGQIVDYDSNVALDSVLAIKNSALGRGLSVQIIWLVIMFVLGAGVVFAMVTGMKDLITTHPNLAVGVIGLVFFVLEVIMTIIGALLHILNVGVVIVLVMTELFVVVMAVRRLGTGG